MKSKKKQKQRPDESSSDHAFNAFEYLKEARDVLDENAKDWVKGIRAGVKEMFDDLHNNGEAYWAILGALRGIETLHENLLEAKRELELSQD